MKKKIQVFDYAGDILKALPGGVLLTAKANGRVNSMTIGWGTLGIEWAKPVFIAFVRENRFTRGLLEENPEFTINVPMGELKDKRILGVCGSKSGRDMDKVSEAGLTLEQPELISVPGIRQLPLTLECRVLYRQTQDMAAMPQEVCDRFYPQDVDSLCTGSNRDTHIAYYGEIVSAYIIE